MAIAKKSPTTRQKRAVDAITLLKNDHREAEELFAKFEKARNRRQDIALKVCQALSVHMALEEEIFYPAFLEATGVEDVHHEAEIEHDCAKKLIATIEGMNPEDGYFAANVNVLAEIIKHHVHDEEVRGGMFAQAKSADMDLLSLGERIAQRKSELMQKTPGAGKATQKARKASVRADTSAPG